MLVSEIAFGRNCDAAGVQIILIDSRGQAVRAVRMGSISKSRSQRGPEVVY